MGGVQGGQKLLLICSRDRFCGVFNLRDFFFHYVLFSLLDLVFVSCHLFASLPLCSTIYG